MDGGVSILYDTKVPMWIFLKGLEVSDMSKGNLKNRYEREYIREIEIFGVVLERYDEEFKVLKKSLDLKREWIGMSSP